MGSRARPYAVLHSNEVIDCISDETQAKSHAALPLLKIYTNICRDPRYQFVTNILPLDKLTIAAAHKL